MRRIFSTRPDTLHRAWRTRRNALLSPAGFSWGTAALVFALCALALRLAAPDVFFRTETPLLRGASALALGSASLFSGFSSGFSDGAVLAARAEALARENAALSAENQTLRKQAADKAALLGGAPERGANASLMLGVLSGPPVSPYDTLVLAGGSSDGVAAGQEAFGAGGVPIGVVSSVSAGFSRVTLFSAPGFVTRGWVGSANVPLEMRGAGGGAFRATVAQAADVALDDPVFAPGPGALFIGRVARIDRDPASPSADILIQGALNPFSITGVELRDAPPSFADSFSCADPLP